MKTIVFACHLMELLLESEGKDYVQRYFNNIGIFTRF